MKVLIGQDELRTFLTVAKLASFSKAADQLCRTTSTVSYRIKVIEDRLGVQLFIRTTRKVTLTPSGRLLYEKATQIFDWMHSLPEEILAVEQGIAAHFNIVINNLLYDAEGAAKLLHYLSKRFPHTQFTMQRQVYMGVWDRVINSGAHMAIGAPGFDTFNDYCLVAPLGVINWTFVVAPHHPLATSSFPLSDEDLRCFPAINVEDTALNMSKKFAWRLPRQQEFLVPDMHTKIRCHIEGLGVGFLPSHTARELIRQNLLVECEVVNGRIPSALSIAWQRDCVGKITNNLLELFNVNDPIISWIIDPLEPATDTPIQDSLLRISPG